MNNPVDLMSQAKVGLKTFAKTANTPVVIESAVPLASAVLAAAQGKLDGICPGTCTPSCWEMARTVVVLMPDGSEQSAVMFFHCQCVDTMGQPCAQPAPVAPAAP